jgi:hypothetical protein
MKILAFCLVALLWAVTASGAPVSGFRTPTLSEAHAATVRRLKAEHLTYHWVACLDTNHRFKGVTVVRCNVDFGDPHIVAYCTVFRGTAALTQFDNAAIPCGPDLSGPQFTITSSG